jgi:hypothetical protein
MAEPTSYEKCEFCGDTFDIFTSDKCDICIHCSEDGVNRCYYCHTVVEEGHTNTDETFACIDCIITKWIKS